MPGVAPGLPLRRGMPREKSNATVRPLESMREPFESRMDVPREPPSRKRRYVLIAAAVLALVLITVAIARLDPAAPTVDRNAILIGTVEQGSFTRSVRGPGTLVPEQMRYVSALTAGRVEEVLVQPGSTVQAGTVLLRLSNPDVQLEALRAQQQWTAAQGALVELRRSLGSQRLAQEAAVATAHAEYLEAARQAEADSALAARQLISRDAAQRSAEQAAALSTRLRTEEERLQLVAGTMDAQLAVQADQVQRLQAIYDYQERRVESMDVTAGAGGVLQDLSLEVGQWVQSGTALARVAEPGQLKAEIRIPQTQARDVAIGQAAMIDTRNDTLPGTVRRIDPNVQNGTVLVEVGLPDSLPEGLRPDLSVDGTIVIERLEDVLSVERPAFGQSESAVGVFKLVDDGQAVRTTVQLGRGSVHRIEVVSGLEAGDRIILSDMSRWDDAERVEIE